MTIATRNSGATTRAAVCSRCTWPSSNEDGVPDLLRHRLWQGEVRGALLADRTAEGPLLSGWTVTSPGRRRGHVLHHYVDDYRQEVLWSRAGRMTASLVAARPAAVVEADLSLYADMPLTAQRWNSYRCRWLARAWQEAGLLVLPSLNWSTPASYEFAWLGLPRPLPLACVEARGKGRSPAFLAGLSAAVEWLGLRRCVAYGAPPEIVGDLWPRGVRWECVPAWSPRRRSAGGVVGRVVVIER
jgi:hypothetical protein